MKENTLTSSKNFLISMHVEREDAQYIDIYENFGGTVTNIETFNASANASTLYLCGNISLIYPQLELNNVEHLYIIQPYSYSFENFDKNSIINLGQVPINIHNVGIYFRKLFEGKDYFKAVVSEHEFQSLTQTNKPGTALRKGLYMTPITKRNDELHFHLLRCSTNFQGPTDNYRKTDHEIVDTVTRMAAPCYDNKMQFNHTLAQIYYNSINMDRKIPKERKAKIKEHSDKTKDMPINGGIAFVTFYDNYNNGNFDAKHIKISKDNPYDHCYKNQSVLTRLRFRLKNDVDDPNLIKKFDLILYPNSVFVISLRTNRLYTHEIIPSTLPIDKIPIRMGYVVRTADQKAVYKDSKTHLIYPDTEVELVESTDNNIRDLKDIYWEENRTSNHIIYPEVNYSLNKGDYMTPIY